MSIHFRPSGDLNVSTAPTDLPSDAQGRDVISEEMTRCKNLSVDRRGRVDTRDGSTRPSANAMTSRASFILEQAGDRYAFVDSGIYKNEAALTATGLTDGDWSAVSYNAFNETSQSVFALNGTDRKRIDSSGNVREWGIDGPGAAPTVAVGAGTGLTGTYKVKITYARLSGSTVLSESNPSDASSGQALTNEDLAVTWVASSDAQVTHVRIYRTLAGGSIYFFDQNVAVGTLTVDTSTADASLAGEVATNHDRPPAGTIVAGPFYNGIIFIAKGNLLYWCLAKQPEYVPATNFIEVGPPSRTIKAIVDLGGQAYCVTDKQLWYIQGAGAGTFNPIPLQTLAGGPNQFGAAGVEGRGIYHLGRDGLYLYSGGRDTKVSQTQFEALFDSDATELNGMQPVGAWPITTQWLWAFENKLYFHYGVGNLIVLNLDTSRSTYYTFDQQLYAPTTDHTNRRFYVGDAGRFVRRVEDPSATDDVGSGIDWEVESMEFTLQTRRHFPRWIKYDADVEAATNVTGKVILDGAVHHTHSLTSNRKTARRLIDTGNGRRCSIRFTGTGTATVYAAEME